MSIMTRPPDLAWDALVAATLANPAMERGALNTALRAIREACMTEGLHPDEVPAEITRRADAYRRHFPGLTLTPTALAKHWFRVVAEPAAQARNDTLERHLRRVR